MNCAIRSLDLHNSLSLIEIRPFDLHNAFKGNELQSERTSVDLGNKLQSEGTSCVNRRIELQSKRTSCVTRGNKFANPREDVAHSF